MKFEEALVQLRNGKKIVRIEDGYKFELTLDDVECGYTFYLGDLNGNWEVVKEPLLLNEEKEYLKAIMKFNLFEVYEVSVSRSDADGNYIKIYGEDDEYDTTTYVKSKYFKNLESDKKYTLEELGI